MDNCDLFLKTLKLIRYPEVDFLDDSDIRSIVSEKELLSFFEVFGSLSEKNILNTEEIEEYLTLTSDEIAEIETVQLQDNNDVHDKKKEVLFLQEQLAHLKNRNKSIEQEIDLFKKHEEDLLEEKEIQQNKLLDARKSFQTYEMTKIPQTEEVFVSRLKCILEVAEDLKFLILNSDPNESKLPTSNFFKDIIQQHLNFEEKTLQCINEYLQSNFQLQDGVLSFIAKENTHREELIKDAFFLQKVLKNSMIEKVFSEKEIQKIENEIKYLVSVKISDFNCHLSQLRYKLEDALKINEQLKKKECELETYAFDAGLKYSDSLLTEIDLCANNEAYSYFQFCKKKISLPMDTLINQRARLELLIAFLNEHKLELQRIKDLIQEVLKLMKQEQLDLEERESLIQSKMTAMQKKNESDPEEVVLSSLCKILGSSDAEKDIEISSVSESDLVEKANRLFQAKEDCLKKSEEKKKIVEFLEKHVHSMEALLNCSAKEYSNWHEKEQELNVSLNNLNLKLTSLQSSMIECNQDLDQKQKILERKGNLRLARNLYIYALQNKELFEKCIDDIFGVKK